MPNAKIIQLCDAVASDLREAAFILELEEVKRTYIPSVEAKDLPATAALLFVVPTDEPRERVSRQQWNKSPSIHVGVFVRIDPTRTDRTVDEQADDCMLLIEQLAEFYENRTPSDFDCPLMTVSPAPLWSPDYLDSSNIFASVLELKFQHWG